MKKEYILYRLSDTVKTTSCIESSLFKTHNVKRGLRNEDHSGVLVGLTKIGDVVGYQRDEDAGFLKAVPGELIYRGIDVEELVSGIKHEHRSGYEEIVFLLLSGYLPDKEELATFSNIINSSMQLDQKLTMNIIDLEGHDIMNVLARTVLGMYRFDDNPDDISRENLIRQSISLISSFPTIVAYAYNAWRHANKGFPLHIRHPKQELSIAENFLYLLKGEYSELEAKILDIAFILHAEHGGGNNSTFTVRVTSSSETDTYSSIAAAVGSLKGPLHGGANLAVMDMFEHLKGAIKDWTSTSELDAYLLKILKKEAYNKKGLIYGIGHAVYTISDPRAVILKNLACELAIEKGRSKEFEFLSLVEERAVKSFMDYKGEKIGKSVCANVDLYSGFVYDMIGLPKEIFTPLFAISRIAGWCAHRIEELNFAGERIIRPAYKNVTERKSFIPLNKR